MAGYLKIISIMLIVVLINGITISCGNDDDDKDNNIPENVSAKYVKQKLTSTVWYRRAAQGSKNSNMVYLKFNNDGTVYYSDFPDFNDEHYYGTDMVWAYNENTSMLRMYTVDGYYQYGFYLELLDNGDWVGTDNTTSTTIIWIFTPYKKPEGFYGEENTNLFRI